MQVYARMVALQPMRVRSYSRRTVELSTLLDPWYAGAHQVGPAAISLPPSKRTVPRPLVRR